MSNVRVLFEFDPEEIPSSWLRLLAGKAVHMDMHTVQDPLIGVRINEILKKEKSFATRKQAFLLMKGKFDVSLETRKELILANQLIHNKPDK